MTGGYGSLLEHGGALAVLVPFVITALVILMAVGLSGMIFRKFRERILPPPIPPRFSDYIDIHALDFGTPKFPQPGKTILFRSGWQARVWRIAGEDHGSLSHQQRQARFYSRISCFERLARAGVDIRLISLRKPLIDPTDQKLDEIHEQEKAQAQAERSGNIADGPSPTGLPLAVQAIHDLWQKPFRTGVYTNKHYLIVYAKGAKQEKPPKNQKSQENAKTKTGEKKQSNNRSKNDHASKLLDQAEGAIQASFSDYKPKLLSMEEAARQRDEGEDVRLIDTPLTVFASLFAPSSPHSNPIVGPQEQQANLDQGYNLSNLLAVDEVTFGDGRNQAHVTFSGGNRTRHMRILGITDLGESLSELPIEKILRTPGEIALVHAINPVDKIKALGKLKLEARQARGKSQSDSMDSSADQLEEVISILSGTHESGVTSELQEYALTVLCYGDEPHQADQTASSVERALATGGMQSIRGGTAAVSGFWQILPTWHVFPRMWRVLSQHVGAITLPQQAPTGLTKHDWSDEPLTRFRSADVSPYGFTFHPVDDDYAPGHTIIIGPTGGGKTTLLCHLALETLTIPDSQVWLFDRMLGCEIFTHAVQGSYASIGAMSAETENQAVLSKNNQNNQNNQNEDQSLIAGQSTALNPFSLPNTKENRLFLQGWIKSLITAEGAIIEPNDETEISRAVRLAYEKLPPQMRTLRQIHKSMFRPTGKNHHELRRWVEPDQYGDLFNAPVDTNESLRTRLVAFDCTTALDNPTLAGPLMSYLMHRIRTYGTGRPTLIYIDETEPMLQHEGFRSFFKTGLQEGRKLRQVYVCCFQRPSAIEQSGISDLIRGQCKTAIFLKNAQAQPDDYAAFHLTDGEMKFITGKSHGDLPWAALVKRYDGPHTAIIDTDLSPLGPWLKCYSSGRQDVLRIRSLLREHGHEETFRNFIGPAWLEARKGPAGNQPD